MMPVKMKMQCHPGSIGVRLSGAERSGAVLAFSAEIGCKLEPLFSKLYDDPSQIGAEVQQVVGIL